MAGWIVQHDGPCSECGALLRAGTEAVWRWPPGRMFCLDCAATPPPADDTPIDRGVAGRSARDRHGRLAAARETRIKAKLGDRFGGWYTRLSDEPQSIRAWASGADGEEKLGKILDGLDGVRVLHDRGVPGQLTNIDHIVVAPGGVFVVDAKHYQGQVEVRQRGSFFRPEDRLFVGGRDRTTDIDGIKAQVTVVESVLGSSQIDPKPSVTPVLCFTRATWPWFGAAKSFGGVYLESDTSIRKLLMASGDYAVDDLRRTLVAIGRALPPR
jgi:hypothetical protein